MSAIFAQRLTGPLASLDETWRHVHEMLKESAYKGLVRSILEYGSSVWDPQSILLQDELEKVQKGARFVTGYYVYKTGSMTGILKQLKWESLKRRRKDMVDS